MTLLNPDVTGNGQVWNIGSIPTDGVVDGCAVILEGAAAYRFRRGGADQYALVYDISDNGGVTWGSTVITALKDFATVQAAPFNGNVSIANALVIPGTPPVYLIGSGSSHTLLRSTDLRVWSLITLPGSGGGAVTSLVRQGDTVGVSGQLSGNTPAFFLSTDKGLTFGTGVQKDNGLTVIEESKQVLASPIPNVWLWLGAGGNIYRSVDNGVTFTSVKTLVAGTVNGYAILALDERYCVAVIKGQVYTSDDVGATWTARQNLSASLGDIGFLGYYGNGVVGGLACQLGTFGPTTDAVGAWRSTDYGVTWLPITVHGGMGNAAQGFAALGTSTAQLMSFVVSGASALGSASKLATNTLQDIASWSNASVGAGIGLLERAGLGECSSFGVCPCK
jgi:hypothetical protein